VHIFAGDRELAKKELPPGSAASRRPQEFLFPDADDGRRRPPQQVRVKLDGAPGSVLDVMWVEFTRQ
jgi:hypothetical protein